MRISRTWAMPNSNTFSIRPIRALIERYIVPTELWIDPFANNNKFATITNDLDSSFGTDFNDDALIFLKRFKDESVDGVLFDPPYSPRQVSECYKKHDMSVNMKTTQASYWGQLKKEIARTVKAGGICVTFSWNSGGIGKKHGFKIEEILLVPHGSWHNDTIVTIERKLTIEDFLQVEG